MDSQMALPLINLSLDDLWTAYYHLATQIVPGPLSLSYFVPIFLLPAALLIPPSLIPHRPLALFTLPIIYATTFHAWRAMDGVDVVTVDVLLWSTYLLGFVDARSRFRRVRRTPPPPPSSSTRPSSSAVDDKAPKTWDEPFPSAPAARLDWVLDLVSSYRLVDWKTGRTPRHDALQSTRAANRSAAAVARGVLPLLCADVVLFYLAAHAARGDDYFTDPSLSLFHPYPTLTSTTPAPTTLLRALLPPPVLRAVATAAYAFATVTHHLSTVPTLFSLLLPTRILPHAWSFRSLPPLYGPPSAVLSTGLRGFWGTFWHQTMRAFNSAPGVALADALRLQRRASARYALMVASAFFFSGIAHMGLVPSGPARARSMRLATAAFFWAQPVGILVEVGAGAAWSRLAPSSAAGGRGAASTTMMKLVRAAWSLVWLCATAGTLLGPVSRGMGYWRVLPGEVRLGEVRTWMPLVPVPLWPVLFEEGRWW